MSSFQTITKLIAIDLSKQIELEDLELKQQISFIGKLEGQLNEATMFFLTEKSEETPFEFLQKICEHHIKMEKKIL